MEAVEAIFATIHKLNKKQTRERESKRKKKKKSRMFCGDG
jgi:hypothetical protein